MMVGQEFKLWYFHYRKKALHFKDLQMDLNSCLWILQAMPYPILCLLPPHPSWALGLPFLMCLCEYLFLNSFSWFPLAFLGTVFHTLSLGWLHFLALEAVAAILGPHLPVSSSCLVSSLLPALKCSDLTFFFLFCQVVLTFMPLYGSLYSYLIVEVYKGVLKELLSFESIVATDLWQSLLIPLE